MSIVRIAFLAVAFCLLSTFLCPHDLWAQGSEDLKRGVVKITARGEGQQPRVGTGFIVRMDKDATYIVTAAHVVAGDTHPKVEFFTKRNLPVTADVLGLEGDDEVRGLAMLVVKGSENLPKGLTSLSLAGAARLTGGEDIMVIGFPRNAGPWAVVKGNIYSRQGRDIFFTPSVESGHSGGPIFQGGKVVAVVGAGSQSVGRGVTARSVEDFIEGFGITAQESAGSSSSMAPAPSPPPPAPVAKPDSQPMTQAREITGKDGAPMVLVPAGSFMMGSTKVAVERQIEDCRNRLKGEFQSICGINLYEFPRHQVWLDGFYMDKFEVTVASYAEFVRTTGRAEPKNWDWVDSGKHRNLPIVGIDWYDATAYCEWSGKRLPTEAEWEKAARGMDERTYPWGNEQPTTRLANFGKGEDPLRMLFNPVEADPYDGRVEPVDRYEAGMSPYGLHHMAGNASEWTADWYDANFYSKSPERNPKGPSIGESRVVRGGSWGDASEFMRSAKRYGNAPTFKHGSIGFRCAQDVPK